MLFCYFSQKRNECYRDVDSNYVKKYSVKFNALLTEFAQTPLISLVVKHFIVFFVINYLPFKKHYITRNAGESCYTAIAII